MAVNALKIIFLTADIDYAVNYGGLTPTERNALAKRFAVSEDALLRYERAKCAYVSLVKAQWQAMAEAAFRMSERGEEYDSKKLADEMGTAFDRKQEAALKKESRRELHEAEAALKAALDASSSSQDR
jgi:hypothetical protein